MNPHSQGKLYHTATRLHDTAEVIPRVSAKSAALGRSIHPYYRMSKSIQSRICLR